MLLLQEFEFEVIYRPRSTHVLADYLSCIDSRELLEGTFDDFLDAKLFLTSSIPEESDVVLDNVEIPSIPWS